MANADTGSRKPAPRSIVRKSVAWLLIILGLAEVVGGLGMICIYSIIPTAGMKDAEARARLFGRYLPWTAHTIGFCGGGCAGILFGSILIYIGVRLRPVERRNESSSQRLGADPGPKRTCPACGGRSPATAPKCYQCGQTFPAG